jgi:hypothetical protein
MDDQEFLSYLQKKLPILKNKKLKVPTPDCPLNRNLDRKEYCQNQRRRETAVSGKKRNLVKTEIRTHRYAQTPIFPQPDPIKTSIIF